MQISFNIPSYHKQNSPLSVKNIKSPKFRGKDFDAKNLTLTGSETQAKVYTRDVDYQTIEQIKTFCNHPVFKDIPIRIMPDAHSGKNSVVGFSAPLNPEGKVIPNIIGGDIGCGMLCIQIDTKGQDIDFEKLDEVIKMSAGAKNPKSYLNSKKIPNLYSKEITDICKNKYKKSPEEVMNSLGTLGGGNHFIEIDKDTNGNYYLVIHSGSRHFGKETASYHQEKAERQNPYKIKDLSYLSGAEAKDYLDDMKLAIKYSHYNRQIIADKILSQMGWEAKNSFESIHNYISEDGFIRKGAISANKGEKTIIPLNMRDGAIIGEGKGNSDWNYTAPHGAGRRFKRSLAKEFITLDEYKNAMKGIYTSSVSQSSIDESPQAYKDSAEIIDNVEETVDIADIITPVFNYKN